MLLAKNESQRIKDEIGLLKKENPELLKLMLDLRDFAKKKFNKDIVLTMIGRTNEEQAYLYRNSERYAKRAFKSPHQFWHAFDIRSWVFTTIEISNILNYLNNKYDSNNFYRWTAQCHDVGSGMHFHIQYIAK